ncbi:MAG: hypothetical protein ACYCUI_09510 [Vulcanimicrobiaceae bacterium]
MAKDTKPRRKLTPEQIAERDSRIEAAEADVATDRAHRAILRRMQATIQHTPLRAIPIKEVARRLSVSVDTLERRGPPPSILRSNAAPGQRAVRYCDESEVEALIGPPAVHAAWVRRRNAREAAMTLLADKAEAEAIAVAEQTIRQGVPRKNVLRRLEESQTILPPGLFLLYAAGQGDAPKCWPFMRYERNWQEADMRIDDVVDLETACIEGVDCSGWIGPPGAKGARDPVQIEWLTWRQWSAIRTEAETCMEVAPAKASALARRKALSLRRSSRED